MINVDYKLEQIVPKVFLVTIKDQYDLAMTFCRIQEFYESSFKEIKGKAFTIAELQRLYSKNFGHGAFTYPLDWAGFNIPGNIIYNLYHSDLIKDHNEYDDVFEKILNKIGSEIEQDDKYYVIGSEPNNKDTINHELAHAFYYLYPAYKKKADLITDQLPQKIISGITSYLLSIGYNKKVLKDEFQAYLCSNADIILNEVPKRNQKESKKLSKLHCDLIDLLEEYKKIS